MEQPLGFLLLNPGKVWTGLLSHSHSRTFLRFWLAGWLLLVGIDSPTAVPTLEPRETDVVRRSDEIDPRTISPFIPLALPHPNVQSPGVDIIVIVDTAFWCFALMCKPLAKPRALRTGLQNPTPTSKSTCKSWKIPREIRRHLTSLDEGHHLYNPLLDKTAPFTVNL